MNLRYYTSLSRTTGAFRVVDLLPYDSYVRKIVGYRIIDNLVLVQWNGKTGFV